MKNCSICSDLLKENSKDINCGSLSIINSKLSASRL